MLQAPQLPEKWQGVREAKEDGHGCYAKNFDDYSGSEDCLYLNIFTKEVSYFNKYFKRILIQIKKSMTTKVLRILKICIIESLTMICQDTHSFKFCTNIFQKKINHVMKFHLLNTFLQYFSYLNTETKSLEIMLYRKFKYFRHCHV